MSRLWPWRTQLLGPPILMQDASDGVFSLWTTNLDQFYPDLKVLADAVAGRTVAGQTTLKTARRRHVFRLCLKGHRPAVIKAFPLDLLARFRYRKYALKEYLNYQTAQTKGIPSPDCRAYFEVRKFGLVKTAGLLLEDLTGWRDLHAVLALGLVEEAEAMRLVGQLFALMFASGVNHIDTTPENILFSPDLSKLKLIDWQWASFHEPRQPKQLVLQTGRLLAYGRIDPDSERGRRWTAEIHLACAYPVPLGRFQQQVAACVKVKQHYRDRLALRISWPRSIEP